MTKGKKILLLSALGSMAIGILLILCAVFLTGFQASTLLSDKRVKHLTEIGEPFDSIDIQTNLDSVTFVSAEGSGAAIELYEDDTVHYTVSVNDGKLTIQCDDNSRWYSFISLHIPTKRELRLFLPSDIYKNVAISTNIGSVTIPDSFRIEELSIHTDIGSVKVPKATGANKDSTEIHTGIGSVTVDKNEASDHKNIHIDTGIGDIHVN